jgi:sorting nexin-29
LLQKTNEYNIKTYHLFVDFKSAYDTVDREQLCEAMKQLEIKDKLIRLVKMTITGTRNRVKIQDDLSGVIKTDRGLRQGDALACLLFNIALEKVIRYAGTQRGGTIYYKLIRLLRYADDIGIFARTPMILKEVFLSLEKAAKRIGLLVNEQKTKYKVSGHSHLKGRYIIVAVYKFERVEKFSYLGSLKSHDNDVSQEVKQRIVVANKCYYGLARQLKSRFLSRHNKIKIYKTLIRPVLAYGSET